MRFVYTVLFYLLVPIIFLRLLWRSRKQSAYRERWSERLGFYHNQLDQCIWVHAVSVGEAIAAIPLIRALQTAYPTTPLLVTTMTPTGSERVRATFGETVTHVYIPYDLPFALRRFFRAFHPKICLIIETELWPNTLAVCHEQHVPVCLLNARLSEQSAAGYRKVKSLTRNMLQQLTFIAAHANEDAARFIELGADKAKVHVTGNIKFDLELPVLSEQRQALRNSFGDDRFIWIAASTHPGEEEIILAAHEQILKKNPRALLILVPRHPDRFDEIAKLCERQFQISRRSKGEINKNAEIYLGDTMGEMMLLYSVADAAFVAGSLMPRGGHNLLEPGVLGKPILSGPSLFNFADIRDLFLKSKALIIVQNATELATNLLQLMQDQAAREAYGIRAREVVDANRGALQKQMQLIAAFIK